MAPSPNRSGIVVPEPADLAASVLGVLTAVCRFRRGKVPATATVPTRRAVAGPLPTGLRFLPGDRTGRARLAPGGEMVGAVNIGRERHGGPPFTIEHTTE